MDETRKVIPLDSISAASCCDKTENAEGEKLMAPGSEYK